MFDGIGLGVGTGYAQGLLGGVPRALALLPNGDLIVAGLPRSGSSLMVIDPAGEPGEQELQREGVGHERQCIDSESAVGREVATAWGSG